MLNFVVEVAFLVLNLNFLELKIWSHVQGAGVIVRVKCYLRLIFFNFFLWDLVGGIQNAGSHFFPSEGRECKHGSLSAFNNNCPYTRSVTC